MRRAAAVGGGVIAAALARVRRAARRVRDKLGPRAAILLYHRVSDTPTDPFLLRVRTRHFEEQMEVLRKHPRARPLPLAQLARAQRGGQLPGGAVAVTFDDGYIDNLRVAKPILSRHEIPATVFMTTGAVGRTREFWWDELEQIVLPPSQHGDAHAGWDLLQPTAPTPAHRRLRELREKLRPMRHADRERALDQLAAEAGVTSSVRQDRRAMSDDEIVELGKDGQIDVGAHTNLHSSLPSHSPDEQRDEIAGSRRRLEELLRKPVMSFAYPYGDYAPQTMAIVRDAGFETACACDGRITTPRSDPLALPRLDVLDWDGDEFARRLEGWLRG